jgi:hypothetical protein
MSPSGLSFACVLVDVQIKRRGLPMRVGRQAQHSVICAGLLYTGRPPRNPRAELAHCCVEQLRVQFKGTR